MFFLPGPVTLSVLSIFLYLLVHSPEPCPQNSSIFFVLRLASLYVSCLEERRSKLVGCMCSMLPYGTGICCYAFIYFFFYCCCPFLFYTFLESGIDKSMVWSTIPACPSLMCVFLTGAIPKGLVLRKNKSLMFVYVFCTFVSGLI